MRPVGPALSDAQRAAYVIVGRIEQGDTQQQAIDYLTNRFPQISQQDALTAYNAALAATGSLVGLSFAQPGDTIGQAAGIAGGPDRNLVVESEVVIRTPGREDEHRTLRFTIPAGFTLSELNDRIQANAESFAEEYGTDGTTSTWSIRFIM